MTADNFSGSAISVNLDLKPSDKLSQKNGLDSKTKIVKRSSQSDSSRSLFEKESTEKCEFPIKSGSSKIQEFPENFDVRTLWPFCVSTVTQDDGSNSVSALLFSVDYMSDLICTIYGDKIDVKLTIEQMEKSTENSKEKSSISNECNALKFWTENGIYSLDYKRSDYCLPFSPQCGISAITRDKYFKVNVTIPLNIPDKMKDLITKGPAIAFIEIHEDFLGNRSGIYEKRSDERLGVYPFKMIGWGVEDGVDYWLGMKVWGRDWGDKGAFKIRREEDKNGPIKNWLSVSLDEEPVSNHGMDDEQSFYLAHSEKQVRYENINGCLVVRNP